MEWYHYGIKQKPVEILSIAERFLDEIRKDERPRREIALEFSTKNVGSRDLRLVTVRSIILRKVTTKDDIDRLEKDMGTLGKKL